MKGFDKIFGFGVGVFMAAVTEDVLSGKKRVEQFDQELGQESNVN